MAFSEEQYINLCIKQIEEKFSFENGSLQRNLEILSQQIEEKTKIRISLSTLKRLWKGEFKQSPQLATLNALAAMLEYKDWYEFRRSNRQNVKTTVVKANTWFLAVFLLLAAVIVILTRVYNSYHREPKINGPIKFSTEKTVTSGIPNTVIFNYDVSNVEADSFFIQQTWNDRFKSKINPNGSSFSSIYYESGYHRARLIANNTQIALQPVHILSNGWEPHVYYSYDDLIPIGFEKDTFIENGQLHLKKEILEKEHVDLNKNFFTRISNSQVFDVSSDNFSFFTRIKVDSIKNSMCPWINIIIVTEVHIFSISLQMKGCEHYANYKLGEVQRSGNDNNLSALGCNVYQWQDVAIDVRNKSAEVTINGKTAVKEKFKEDFGKIVGLIYIFEGTGSIDYVKLAGSEGHIAFEDDFNSQQ